MNGNQAFTATFRSLIKASTFRSSSRARVTVSSSYRCRQHFIIHRCFSSISPLTLRRFNRKITMASNNISTGEQAVRAGVKTLTIDNINPNIKNMEYAVRGPIVIKAAEIEKELEQGVKKPFKEVIRCNIGDCHSLGQQPITFIRQVLAICSYPELLNDKSFPEDAKERAQRVLCSCKGKSVGSYSDSAGVEAVRRDVASYIEKRDGYPSNHLNVMLCAGASEGIRSVMKLLNYSSTGSPPGIMIPIPQYPLYTASIAEFGMQPIPYYLNEDKNWALNIEELKRSIEKGREHSLPRGIVIINPGNPTGQVLTKENIKEIISFASQNGLFIFADEVYQHNVYAAGSEFHSFKKVMMEMGEPYSRMELASFMSTSKGYMGECGLRGGYSEVINLDPQVQAMLNKSISAKLCPTVLGQATLETVVNPPKPGEPSYELFTKEKNAVLNELKKRAKLIEDGFNSVPGMHCNVVQGAMYAFPKIDLPPKAIAAAKKEGYEPDFFYAMRLLEEAGICVVPGSGFGQIPGTYHFRTTILPPTDRLEAMLQLFKQFHLKFLEEYKASFFRSIIIVCTKSSVRRHIHNHRPSRNLSVIMAQANNICVFLLVLIVPFNIDGVTSEQTEEFPFLMPEVKPPEPDTYFCTTVEVYNAKTSYIVGFRPNATMETAHHMLLYGCTEPGSQDEVWDCGEMSRRPSGTSNVKSAPVCAKGAQVIYAWAHDAPELILPEGVGFKIGKGSGIQYLVLQVHYASVYRFTHGGEVDTSGIVLTVTDKKMPKTAGVYLLGTNGRILPRSHEMMETACRIDDNIKMHPFAFRTHTHTLGKAVSGYLVRKSSFLDFSPDWILLGKKDPQLPQMFYPIEDPSLIIRKGDIVAARCTMYNNRAQTVRIGPTADDEMCNFYIMYWVDGDKTLKNQYCFSWGPPFFYWRRYPLFNIPDADASTL
ncbi:hypothetical protein CHUAL_001824 [Chamberlinius hualienensis]